MNGTRIATLQRSLRELGRLRMGTFGDTKSKTGKPLPASSETWILTSHRRDLLDQAREMWGGPEPERWQPQGAGAPQWRLRTETNAIEATLPPGDTLSQAYEMWSGGGCTRRCDGIRDQISNGPCACAAQFGEDWHESADPKLVCKPYTRLGLFLPLDEFGLWRVESKGYYAAVRIPGLIDYIRGLIGPQYGIPVIARIEPMTTVRKGSTQQAVELVLTPAAEIARYMLAAATRLPELGAALQQPAAGAAEQPAIAAAPAAEPPPAADDPPTALHLVLQGDILTAVTREQMQELKAKIDAAGLTGQLAAVWSARARRIAADEAILNPPAAPPQPEQPPPAPTPQPTDLVSPLLNETLQDPMTDQTWTACVAAAGRQGMNTAQATTFANQWLADHGGTDIYTATEPQARALLAYLQQAVA